MPAPLIKSHPEIVKEIRRLAKNGKSRAQIIAAIKEKFNYNTTFTAVNDWAGVDFKPVGSGTPLSPEKIEEIKNLMSGDNPPTHKEAAKILGVGERSIHQYKDTAPYRTPKQWAEQYPDLEHRLLSSDRAVAVTALNTASARQQREVARAVADAAEISKLEDPDFTPLTDEQAREFAEKKADHIVKGQKTRALLYRISPGIGPENFVSYPEYRKLQKSGNAPEILGRRYQGDFSPGGMAALRKIVYDKLYPYLKAGGNPATFDQHLGHIIAMKGVDPGTKQRTVSGLTNIFNAKMQNAALNIRQSNKVSKALLRKLGYHTPGFMGILFAGLAAPWGKLRADPVTEIPSYLLEAGTGLKPQKVVQDTGRISPWRVGATIAQDTASDIAGILRTDDIPQEPYYGMGRQRGLLDTGHPGIGQERRKRRTNIWT